VLVERGSWTPAPEGPLACAHQAFVPLSEGRWVRMELLDKRRTWHLEGAFGVGGGEGPGQGSIVKNFRGGLSLYQSWIVEKMAFGTARVQYWRWDSGFWAQVKV
jgi:hypothetical protein